MTDIVERLQCNDPYTEPARSRDAMDDAIAEIIELRAKLELLRRIAGKASVEGMTFSDIKKEIRK